MLPLPETSGLGVLASASSQNSESTEEPEWTKDFIKDLTGEEVE